jgi:hypothetical protein
MRAQLARGVPSLPVVGDEFPSGQWSRLDDARNWERDTFYKVRSLVTHAGALYASLTGPNPDGPRGEVWAFAEGRWRRIGGEGDAAWPAGPLFVEQLTVHEGQLHAAVGGSVLRYEREAWTDVGGRLSEKRQAGPYAFASVPEGLAVSLWGDPAVVLLDGARTVRLPAPQDGWGTGVRTVYSLSRFRSQLYAGTGTGKLFGPSASVFRFDGKSWEKIGGGGVRGSWSQPGIPFVLSLRVYGDVLIAALSRPHETPAAASSIWAFDGDEWRPVAVGHTPDVMARSLIMNDLLVYKDRLIAATGDSDLRQPRVWALAGSQQWLDVSGPALEPQPSRHPGGAWVYSLATDGERIFAGTAGHQGSAGVYCFEPDVIFREG